jgi:hypothetical protein
MVQFAGHTCWGCLISIGSVQWLYPQPNSSDEDGRRIEAYAWCKNHRGLALGAEPGIDVAETQQPESNASDSFEHVLAWFQPVDRAGRWSDLRVLHPSLRPK